MLRNDLTDDLQIEHPIIQAPMAGGVTTSSLVSAVSNHGGLGMIGAGYMSPGQIREQIKDVRKLTANQFGINLFVPNEFTVKENDIVISNQLLQPIRDQLNIKQENVKLPSPKEYFHIFHEQIQVIIEEKIPVCSFTFGIPSKEVISALKQKGIILIGTATTVKEAIEVEKSGMDIVVVQGSEAGGHRGNFISSAEDGMIGLMSLIPQVVDHVSIPVIAAGGIMDGRGVMAAICLGAKAVQMGTAFLTCSESGAHQMHKDAILNSDEDETAVTRAFSGKWARGIKNQLIREMQDFEVDFPVFPIQNTLTQSIRKASSKQNNCEFMSLWSGQSPRLAKNQSVESLINAIISEAKKISMANH
ncbi:nitronate monooxygenase [Bacillus sp. FJAT-50079]|uniref:NAD(P)H-dependent flavin oxidoreductase n=1 Tax=Bacillus sp. FJAT-50079 TaxID=2833577 RepID=UPI001BC9E160|nr:nitronate monooxygenase [Bacillus sp. FJAT-50079]MBS4209442.1 nitronate monooxygenase [Bacillus sp. FJAT-50079]